MYTDKGFSRQQRVSELLHRELSWLIRLKLKDPRIKDITVSHLKVSKDLSHCLVFITSLDSNTIAQKIELLNKAAGFLQGQLGKMLKIRKVPKLDFKFDEHTVQSERLQELFDRLDDQSNGK